MLKFIKVPGAAQGVTLEVWKNENLIGKAEYCTGSYKPPMENWVEIEVEPVKSNGDGTVNTCPESEAEFYSVYARLSDGRAMCIADFETYESADKIRNILSRELAQDPIPDKTDEAIYLEYANDWLSYKTMAEHYNVAPDLLLAKIDRGRNS